MSVTQVFAGIAVRHRDDAVQFYKRVFGTSPFMFPNDDEAAWQLAGGGWVYVVVDVARAGRSVVTLLVDDLDERIGALDRRGVEHEPLAVVEGTVRSIWVTDPTGTESRSRNPPDPGAVAPGSKPAVGRQHSAQTVDGQPNRSAGPRLRRRGPAPSHMRIP